MQADLLKLLCKKNSIAYIVFDSNFTTLDLDNITLEKNSDIREYLWELNGLEDEILSLVTTQQSLQIPMLLKDGIYYDLEIETFLSNEQQFHFIAYMQKKSKRTYEYTNAIKEMNKKTLVYEMSDEKKEYGYYKEINKHLISFHVNLEGIITMVNDACVQFFDLEKEKMIGKHFSNFFHAQKSQLDKKTNIFIAKNASKQEVFFHTDIIPITDENGTIKENIIMAQDITHLKKIKRELEYAQEHDSLTGLANRHHFLKKLDRLNQEKISSLSLCFIDIDDFSTLNEEYGAHAGDMLLKHFTMLMLDFLEEEDTLFRLFADKFIILFSQKKQETYIKALCKGLQELVIQNPLYYNEEDIIHFNYTSLLLNYPDDAKSAKELLQIAQKKLKRKKVKKVL